MSYRGSQEIVAICDIFNALTTKRSYKDRMNSYDAFSIMKNEMSEGLSKEYLNQFIKFLAQK